MVFPSAFWVLCLVSLLLCGCGFYRFVWFMSVGYGLAIAGNGAALLVLALSQGRLTLPFALLCLLQMVYGCRLGLFLLVRELKNLSFQKASTAFIPQKPIPLFVKVCMWLCMALLYPVQCAAVLYRFTNGRTGSDLFLWLGAAVMLAGILIEAQADKQKSAAKKAHPNLPAMEGLYRLCRCPNYFGEILFWTGTVLSGANILSGGQWVVVLIGYVAIVYIMFEGAIRLEKRHNKNYGHLPAYRKYADSTPILIPFVPLYHLAKEEK